MVIIFFLVPLILGFLLLVVMELTEKRVNTIKSENKENLASKSVHRGFDEMQTDQAKVQQLSAYPDSSLHQFTQEETDSAYRRMVNNVRKESDKEKYAENEEYRKKNFPNSYLEDKPGEPDGPRFVKRRNMTVIERSNPTRRVNDLWNLPAEYTDTDLRYRIREVENELKVCLNAPTSLYNGRKIASLLEIREELEDRLFEYQHGQSIISRQKYYRHQMHEDKLAEGRSTNTTDDEWTTLKNGWQVRSWVYEKLEKEGLIRGSNWFFDIPMEHKRVPDHSIVKRVNFK